MKKFLFFLMCSLLCCSLFACSNKKSYKDDGNDDGNEDGKIADIQPEDEKIITTDGSSPVSDAQIKRDIPLNDTIQNCFTDKYTYESEYKLIDFEITKRQTNIDDKEDIIFCTVEMQNHYFSVEFNTKLVYNFYDVGGWILDDVGKITLQRLYPLAPAEAELVIEDCHYVSSEEDHSFYENQYVFEIDVYDHNYELLNENYTEFPDKFPTEISSTLDDPGHGEIYTTVFFTINQKNANIKCWETLTFTKYGWEKTNEFECYTFYEDIEWLFDYNSIKGNYLSTYKYWSHGCSFDTVVELIQITDVDLKNFTISYRFIETSRYPGEPWKINQCEDYTESFHPSVTYIGSDTYIGFSSHKLMFTCRSDGTIYGFCNINYNNENLFYDEESYIAAGNPIPNILLEEP